jgi:hypothetical protein
MAETKKSLVEEALLQMKNLEEAVTQNAKGILASTMKEEISELVKESLSEQDEVEDEMVSMEESSEMEKESEMAEQEDEMELDIDMDSEDEESEDDEEMSDMEGEDEGEEMLMMDLPGDELEVDDEEEVLLPLDLTGASDEEILKVFKAMGEEDGIIVTKDDEGIHLKDEESDVEYEIHMESEEEADMDEVVYEIEISEEEDEDGESEEDEVEVEMDEEWKEEVEEEWGSKKHEYKREKGHKTGEGKDGHYKDYEGKFGGNKGDESKTHKGLDYEETTEAAHTLGNGSRNDASKKSLPKMKVKPVNESELKSEVESLRAKNEEYRKALNIFREKLNEVAVFNSNLAYATRLFTEHTTTKQEKINILRRFDSVETLKESKSLYKTLKEEYESKESTPINESVESKVAKTPSRGASTNLIESKTYENPQFLRMKDLMNKLK